MDTLSNVGEDGARCCEASARKKKIDVARNKQLRINLSFNLAFLSRVISNRGETNTPVPSGRPEHLVILNTEVEEIEQSLANRKDPSPGRWPPSPQGRGRKSKC